MPRLAQGATVLEDELRQEAVDIVTQQLAQQLAESWIVRQVRVWTRYVVETEHLADLLLGKARRRVRDRFEHHLGVAHVAATVGCPGDGDGPLPEGGTHRCIGESGNDDEAIAFP